MCFVFCFFFHFFFFCKTKTCNIIITKNYYPFFAYSELLKTLESNKTEKKSQLLCRLPGSREGQVIVLGFKTTAQLSAGVDVYGLFDLEKVPNKQNYGRQVSEFLKQKNIYRYF